MNLVDYSDSDDNSADDFGDVAVTQAVARKKRKIAAPQDLPPLPPSFLDLYSSSVRTSTADDPTLHGGRKRVTPHVAGTWPTHIYIECESRQLLSASASASLHRRCLRCKHTHRAWLTPRRGHPSRNDAQVLQAIVLAAQEGAGGVACTDEQRKVHSLLESHLGVPLPLHISLSRPLSLQTGQKDTFLREVQEAVAGSHVRGFAVRPTSIQWHPNENGSRCFLVLRLTRPPEDGLTQLLRLCNNVALAYGQPPLYQNQHGESANSNNSADHNADSKGRFHISLAWSLQVPGHDEPRKSKETGRIDNTGLNTALLERLQSIDINLVDVKVRIGQDVTTVALRKSRKSSNAAPTK